MVSPDAQAITVNDGSVCAMSQHMLGAKVRGRAAGRGRGGRRHTTYVVLFTDSCPPEMSPSSGF